MQTTQRFAPDLLEILDRTEELQIEPSGDGQAAKRVTIWVVVADGQVYVRSARGEKGRWYQAILRHPQGVLHAGQVRVPFRAERVADPDTLAKVNEAYKRKYGQKWPNETAGMLLENVVPTTLRLVPIR
jgi:hypothetical protein